MSNKITGTIETKPLNDFIKKAGYIKDRFRKKIIFIKYKVGDSRFLLTNGDVYLYSKETGIDCKEEFELALGYTRLKSLCRYANKEIIRFEIEDNDTLSVKLITFALKGVNISIEHVIDYSYKDFQIPKKRKKLFEIDKKKFFDFLDVVAHARSNETNRFNINGFLLKLSNQNITAVATRRSS